MNIIYGLEVYHSTDKGYLYGKASKSSKNIPATCDTIKPIL